MSKSSCEAAKSLEEAFLRMARGERPQARMARGERPLYALFHTFRYSTYATIAVTLSVQTNAHHTPVTPMRRLKTNAAGMITATYRITEITREAIPCPSASKAPGAGHRHSGQNKAQTDDMQCHDTDGDSLRILSKQSDQPSGDQPTQCRTGSHDPAVSSNVRR